MSKPVGPYTPIVRAGAWLVCSGQLGLVDGKLVGGDTAAQAKQGLSNLRALFESEGSSLDAIVKTTVFLTDMADFTAMNEVYAEAFGDHRPARSCVAVAALPLGATFEIEAWAHQPTGGS